MRHLSNELCISPTTFYKILRLSVEALTWVYRTKKSGSLTAVWSQPIICIWHFILRPGFGKIKTGVRDFALFGDYRLAKTKNSRIPNPACRTNWGFSQQIHRGPHCRQRAKNLYNL